MSQNKEQLFIELINQNKGIIYKVSKLYMDTPEDREDLMQEIKLRLWKSFESFEGKSAFSTWMYRVAINTAITFFKNEKRQPELVYVENKLESVLDTGKNEKAEEQLKFFYKAVSTLGPVEKALVFYFMEGLPHRDIARLLGISENNARVKLSRTKEKLQEIIKHSHYEL